MTPSAEYLQLTPPPQRSNTDSINYIIKKAETYIQTLNINQEKKYYLQSTRELDIVVATSLGPRYVSHSLDELKMIIIVSRPTLQPRHG